MSSVSERTAAKALVDDLLEFSQEYGISSDDCAVILANHYHMTLAQARQLIDIAHQLVVREGMCAITDAFQSVGREKAEAVEAIVCRYSLPTDEAREFVESRWQTEKPLRSDLDGDAL